MNSILTNKKSEIWIHFYINLGPRTSELLHSGSGYSPYHRYTANYKHPTVEPHEVKQET